jgi:uncharacterized phage protein (TIGR01671 family)
MNRLIKFRGKSVLNDEWIYGDLVHRIDSPKTISPIQINGIGVKEETVGQFSGLFDKNGKEIYEGDIVEWLFFSYEREYYLKGCIEWHQGGFIFNVTENDSENAGFYAISDLNTDTESDVKILGNIYDNPDLIKEE